VSKNASRAARYQLASLYKARYRELREEEKAKRELPRSMENRVLYNRLMGEIQSVSLRRLTKEYPAMYHQLLRSIRLNRNK
jgi:hypothetical protein